MPTQAELDKYHTQADNADRMMFPVSPFLDYEILFLAGDLEDVRVAAEIASVHMLRGPHIHHRESFVKDVCYAHENRHTLIYDYHPEWKKTN